MPDFEFGELLAAKALGLPAKKLAGVRQKDLVAGKHWDLVKLKVAYSREGLVLAIETLTGAALANGELEKICGESRLQEGATLPAAFIRTYANPHLIEACLEDGRKVQVRVRSSENFRPGMGMRLKAAPLPGGHYELAGKCPRYRGRW